MVRPSDFADVSIPDWILVCIFFFSASAYSFMTCHGPTTKVDGA